MLPFTLFFFFLSFFFFPSLHMILLHGIDFISMD